jgi:DNA-binding NarL/FixJ family response regulator
MSIRMTPSSLREVIVFLDALKRQLPRVKSVVLADRGLESFHALALEAGAICVVNSPRNVDLIARLAQRHFEQVPRHAQSPAERIWGTLPWSREAAGRP